MSGEPIRSSQKNNGEGCVGTLMWSDLSGEQWKSLSSILLGLKKKKKRNGQASLCMRHALVLAIRHGLLKVFLHCVWMRV